MRKVRIAFHSMTNARIDVARRSSTRVDARV